jgi:YVTN family beta-propeller protein
MRVARPVRFVSCLPILLLGILAVASPPAAYYHLLKKVPLGAAAAGGREYFDYLTVDSQARRVYASHGTEVKVVDADSGAVIGTISGLKQCHGIALVEELGKGFISDGGAAKTVIFNMASLKVTGEVKGEEDADSIIYDPASKRVFVFNGDAKSATVIDPANGTVVKSVSLGGGPEFAVADGKGMIYDNIEDTNEVVALDSRALTIKARWPIAPAAEATAMAMDGEHRRLLIGGRNKLLAIMDADNGKIIQTPTSSSLRPAWCLPLCATALCIYSTKTRPINSAWSKRWRLSLGHAIWRSIPKRTGSSSIPLILALLPPRRRSSHTRNPVPFQGHFAFWFMDVNPAMPTAEG